MLCSPEVNFCGMSAEPSFSLAILASRPDVPCYLVFVKLFSALQSTQAANYSSRVTVMVYSVSAGVDYLVFCYSGQLKVIWNIF